MTTASTARASVLLMRWGEMSDNRRFLTALTGVLFVSIFFRLGSVTPDVSWLIDVCARILDGERGYDEVFETTPPIPMLLYMPGAWLEKYAGLPAEFAVISYTYATYLGVLWLSWRILPRQLDGFGSSRWSVIFPFALFLFVLSNDSFAQRETYAAALMTPIVCTIIAWRQSAHWPEIKWRVLTILLAGLGAAVKPPLFALPLMLCGGYLVVATRSLRPLYSSGLIASSFVFAAVTAVSLMAFPEYLQNVYPLMRDVYVPLRHNVIYGLIAPHFIFTCLFLLVALKRIQTNALFSETDRLFSLVAAGFIIVFLYQAKYFDYHAAPIGLFATALAWPTFQQRLADWLGASRQSDSTSPPQPRGRPVEVILLMAIICAGLIYFFDDDEPRMNDRTWADDLDHPTAMAIAAGGITGYPLAREINARWVNMTHCQWSVTWPQAYMQKNKVSEKQRRLFKEYQDRELARVAALIPEKKPEIIIQSTRPIASWLTDELLKRDPGLFDEYTVVAEEGIFRIWRRTDSLLQSSNTVDRRPPGDILLSATLLP